MHARSPCAFSIFPLLLGNHMNFLCTSRTARIVSGKENYNIRSELQRSCNEIAFLTISPQYRTFSQFTQSIRMDKVGDDCSADARRILFFQNYYLFYCILVAQTRKIMPRDLWNEIKIAFQFASIISPYLIWKRKTKKHGNAKNQAQWISHWLNLIILDRGGRRNAVLRAGKIQNSLESLYMRACMPDHRKWSETTS